MDYPPLPNPAVAPTTPWLNHGEEYTQHAHANSNPGGPQKALGATRHESAFPAHVDPCPDKPPQARPVPPRKWKVPASAPAPDEHVLTLGKTPTRQV
jgi:hypothetical protein